jgi:hypothetical protein
MGLLDSIKKVLGAAPAEPRADKVYIVDANSIDQDNQKDMSPHQQINVLKKLAAFAKREGISIHALLDGEPLRVVADGGDFSGVRVFFTRGKIGIEDLIRKRLKSVNADKITVISPSSKLEADIEAVGGQLMSTGTFRKALGGGEGRPRSSGGSGRRRPSSSSRRGRRGGSGAGRAPDKGREKAPAKSEMDHVSELIDLVD